MKQEGKEQRLDELMAGVLKPKRPYETNECGNCGKRTRFPDLCASCRRELDKTGRL